MNEINQDIQARKTAVDIRRSVIVQAPAGSGKTTLLVERILGLLAAVEAPEEILAMTFTRKAAAQMRQRVLDYLEMESAPEGGHEQAAWQKARAVAGKVAEWGLLENPSRLKIMTLDSFNAQLARRMPVLSRLGPVPGLSESAAAHYRLAARRTLENADADVQTLLAWRDNNIREIEDLITDLLPAREQWLRVLGADGAPERKQLEQGLRELIGEQLQQAAAELASALAPSGFTLEELWKLARFGAEHVPEDKPPGPLSACLESAQPPETGAGGLAGWKAVAHLLLTRGGTLRKQVDKNLGFPPQTPEKAAMTELLAALPPEPAEVLKLVRALPNPNYGDAEWQTLAALVRVLQRAARELEVVFAETGEMDFSGMAAAALRALGEAQAPTDLGLYLDHRIRHILVDEFQDTNWNQYYLLEKLTAGWTPDDGRTLFLVGDPMQSIYRFREAEVGLFVQVRDFGLGDLRLESVRLARNFRSSAEIVDWVNRGVGPAFPAADDILHGQVSYAASLAGRGGGGQIATCLGVDRERAQEAAELVELIRTTLAGTPEDYRIAILVRARSHLEFLLPELKRAGIAYRALKLDKLVDRPAVQDLTALTRAIWHPADRTSALAVLRAPWCGLTLADLLTLAEGGRGRTIESLLSEDIRLAALTADGRERARRVLEVLARARSLWRRRRLRDLVEGAWTALGGPHLCDESDLRDAEKYLHHLSMFEQGGDIADWPAFEEYLADQRSEGSGRARVEVLTIHEAKGLEWDMVVLPSLECGSGRTSRKLLHWFSRPESLQPAGLARPSRGNAGSGPDGDSLANTDNCPTKAERNPGRYPHLRGKAVPGSTGGLGERLLIAPLRAAWETESGPLVDTIGLNEARLEAGERQRLLYVAATRARERLVISGSVKSDDENLKPPPRNTLLADLWPVLAAEFERLDAGTRENEASKPPQKLDQTLRRIRSDWRPPCPEPVQWAPAHPPQEPAAPVPFDWAGANARMLGSVTHRLLEYIGRAGVETLDDHAIARLKKRIPVLLGAAGLAPERAIDAAAGVAESLDRTLADDVGRWILSGNHDEAACELPLGGVIQGRLVNAVVDRTFVADGTRWIIDYKSGGHEGGRLDAFLDREVERYRDQLEGYRALFSQMGETGARAALYFPRLAAWREITRN